MDENLKELAEQYLESRNRAIKYPSMADIANESAHAIFTKAIQLGYSQHQWEEALRTLNSNK